MRSEWSPCLLSDWNNNNKSLLSQHLLPCLDWLFTKGNELLRILKVLNCTLQNVNALPNTHSYTDWTFRVLDKWNTVSLSNNGYSGLFIPLSSLFCSPFSLIIPNFTLYIFLPSLLPLLSFPFYYILFVLAEHSCFCCTWLFPLTSCQFVYVCVFMQACDTVTRLQWSPSSHTSDSVTRFDATTHSVMMNLCC